MIELEVQLAKDNHQIEVDLFSDNTIIIEIQLQVLLN